MEKAGSRNPGSYRYHKGGMAVIFVTVLAILAAMWFQSRKLHSLISVYRAREASFNDQIREEENRRDQIEQLREYMQTEEYMEQAARERLGMVKENEIVFEESR